jgi:hypothetical protein
MQIKITGIATTGQPACRARPFLIYINDFELVAP